MASHRLHPARARVLAVVAALAVVGPLALATPVSGQQAPNPVTGLSRCDIVTGAPSIEWTITNSVFTFLTIDSATVTGAVSGSVTFTPNVIDPSGTAVGVTDAPVGTTGSVSITVNTVWAEGELTVPGTSVATATLGPCQAPSTTSSSTTSTGAPATTTTPPTVVAIVATPKFTG